MTDTTNVAVPDSHKEPMLFEFGGLRFDVAFRGRGATLRVFAKAGESWDEVLRFDDFVEDPHFHAPPAVQMKFDRANGEPLAWYIAQIRDHLAEWFEKAGYGAALEGVDLSEVSANAAVLQRAMEECVPSGFARVPGVGLQKV